MSKTKHHNRLQTGALVASVLAASLPGAIAQTATAPAGTNAIPVAEVKKPFWEMNAVLGATITAGNSDSVMVTAGFLAQHKDLKNEIKLGIEGGYGNAEVDNGDSSTTAQFVRGGGQYNRLFTERFYGYVRADGLYDKVAGVDYRFTGGAGAGYYFIKTDKVLLSGEVGPGVVTEQLVSTRGVREYNTYATLRLAENFEYKLSDKTRIWQNAEYLPNVSDWGQYIFNFTVGIETALTAKLSLRSYLQDTYQSEPAPGRVQNDLKWITGIAYKF
jgi:putative salt-induced outer membrane protein